MKILVLSLPRTGSTTFAKNLAKENNISFVFEPFAPNAELLNRIKNFELDYTKDNIVVKTLINNQYDVDWYVEFSKGFNQTYLLSRRNLKQCIDSWAYLNYNRDKIDFESEYFWEMTPNWDESYHQIYDWNDKLINLSNKINIPIIYYEDIFDINKNRLRKGDTKLNRKIV